MNLVVCLDKNGGMLFNKRRQSRDSAVYEKLLTLAQGAPVWMTASAAALFAAVQHNPADVRTDEAPVTKAGRGEWCFFEGHPSLIPWENVEQLHVVLWNRAYPSDTRFPDDELQGKKPVSKENFPGTSHDKITWEVYAL